MLIGHQKQWQFLTKSVAVDKLSHAYLFSGEEKLGKKKMALAWAALILKNDLENPDLILISPQEPAFAKATSGKKEIQIGQIRELIWKLSLKPYSAPFKVAIIDEAHLMNQEAQNALLKTLEEPKEKTIIILTSEYPEMLFPTVVSRCEKIKFYPVGKEVIESYLKKQNLPAETTKEIIEFSLGRPGVAVDFIENPETLSNYKKKREEMAKILTASVNARFQYVKDLSQGPEVLTTLNIWLSYFRDIFLKKYSSATVISGDSAPTDKLKNNLKLIQKIIFLIKSTNINIRLALEVLMLNL